MNIVLPLVLAFAAPASPVPDLSPVAAAARAAEKDGMVVGVSVVQLESGRGISHRGGERFQMASVFKVPVAIAVLDAVERGALRLDQDVEIRESDRVDFGPLDDAWKPGMRVTVARMVDVMLVDSDNTAADKLIALVGGPAAVEKAVAAKGATGIRISLDERGMGAAIRTNLAALERGDKNGATPEAMAALLGRLFEGELLPGPATIRILDAMRRCSTGGRRLRAGLPKDTEVRDKTGTLRSCSNDAGIVALPDGTHLAIAVFTRGGAGAAQRDAAIASVARAAWQAFAPPR